MAGKNIVSERYWKVIWMIEIIDGSIENFYKELQEKKFFLFGAGRKASILYHEMKLEGKIIAIIDNNSRLWDTQLCLGDEKLPVISIKTFLKQMERMRLEDIRLLVTTTFYAGSIIEQLDQMKELDHMKCYIGDLLIEYYEKQTFCFSEGMAKIPKKIHFCWFGEKKYRHIYLDIWKHGKKNVRNMRSSVGMKAIMILQRIGI